jgi:hypothetical protein
LKGISHDRAVIISEIEPRRRRYRKVSQYAQKQVT